MPTDLSRGTEIPLCVGLRGLGEVRAQDGRRVKSLGAVGPSADVHAVRSTDRRSA
jgi:hypothetical protein